MVLSACVVCCLVWWTSVLLGGCGLLSLICGLLVAFAVVRGGFGQSPFCLCCLLCVPVAVVRLFCAALCFLAVIFGLMKMRGNLQDIK